MRTTLADAKGSSLPEAVNLNACDPRFVKLLNDAQYRLSECGKWWGTYARMNVCAPKACLTWPREVKTVEGFNLCGVSIPIRNGWFEFQTYIRAPQTGCNDYGYCQTPQLLERGLPPACQYRDFVVDSKVRLYPAASDVGKRVLLQGKDTNGVQIRTVDSVSGKVVYGEYVTLAEPFVESTNTFKLPHLTGVQKPVTDYNVTATAVDPDLGTETEIAVWQPSETNPSYRRTFLVSRPKCGTNLSWQCKDHGDGCRPADALCTDLSVEILYRQEFIPALVDSDWLIISKLPALEREMVAILQERRNEDQQAEVNHKRAIRFLREELEAYSPQQRLVITNLPEGDAYFNRVYPYGMV